MVQLVEQMLTQLGARVLGVKVSRLDPCADVLIPDFLWDARLSEHFVTRAKKTATHMVSQDPTGFAIGRGDLSARLYDKPREIREKSHKFWMADIWGLPEVPDWHTIARVEFQDSPSAPQATRHRHLGRCEIQVLSPVELPDREVAQTGR